MSTIQARSRSGSAEDWHAYSCRLVLLVPLSLVLAMLLPGDVVAGAPTEQLQAQVEALLPVLQSADAADTDRPQQSATVRKIMEDMFDWRTMAERALGQQWRARTLEEREDFTRLFADFFFFVYVDRLLERYHGERVVFTDERLEDGHAVVEARVITESGANGMTLAFSMNRRPPENWKIVDIEFSGVSLIANYRAQFNKILRAGSYETLAQRIRAKATTPRSESRSTATTSLRGAAEHPRLAPIQDATQ